MSRGGSSDSHKKRQKKPDYTIAETQALIREVRKRRVALFQPSYTGKANKLRLLNWQCVADEVNKFSQVERTEGEARCKWKHLREAALEDYKTVTNGTSNKQTQPARYPFTMEVLEILGLQVKATPDGDECGNEESMPHATDAVTSDVAFGIANVLDMSAVKLTEERKNKDGSKRPKKPDYSGSETEALLREVRKRRAVLFTPHFTSKVNELKRLHWQRVTDYVNTFSFVKPKRTVNEVMCKWRRLKKSAVEEQKVFTDAVANGQPPPELSQFTKDVLDILDTSESDVEKTVDLDSLDVELADADIDHVRLITGETKSDCRTHNRTQKISEQSMGTLETVEHTGYLLGSASEVQSRSKEATSVTASSSVAKGDADVPLDIRSSDINLDSHSNLLLKESACKRMGSRAKKPNFSKAEIEALIQEVSNRRAALLRPTCTARANQLRSFHWQRVADKVSKYSRKVDRRSAFEVRLKWKRLKMAALEEQKALQVQKATAGDMPPLKQSPFSKDVLRILALPASGIPSDDTEFNSNMSSENGVCEKHAKIPRKPYFTRSETEVLIREVKQRRMTLLNPAYSGQTNKFRLQHWQHVAHSVSKCSQKGLNRTVLEVRRKWKGLKSMAVEEQRAVTIAKINGQPPLKLSAFTKDVLGVLNSTGSGITQSTVPLDGNVHVASENSSPALGPSSCHYMMDANGPVAGQNKLKRRRRPNFSEEQVKCILSGVREFQSLLLVSYPDDMFADERKKAWRIITSRVNKYSVAQRTVRDVKRCWRDKHKAAVKHKKNADLGLSRAPWYYTMVMEILKTFDAQGMDLQDSLGGLADEPIDGGMSETEKALQDDTSNSYVDWATAELTDDQSRNSFVTTTTSAAEKENPTLLSELSSFNSGQVDLGTLVDVDSLTAEDIRMKIPGPNTSMCEVPSMQTLMEEAASVGDCSQMRDKIKVEDGRSEIEQHFKVMARRCERLKTLGVDACVMIPGIRCLFSCEKGVPIVMDKLSVAQPTICLGRPTIHMSEQLKNFSASNIVIKRELSSHSSAAASPSSTDLSNSDPVKPTYLDDGIDKASDPETAVEVGALLADPSPSALVDPLPSAAEGSAAEEDCGSLLDGVKVDAEVEDLSLGSNVANTWPVQDDSHAVTDTCTSTDNERPSRVSIHRGGKKSQLAVDSTTSAELEEEEKVCCDICGKFLANVNSLSRHRKLHTTDRSQSGWPCDMCSQVLSSKKTLKAHQKKHQGIEDKDFQCEVCGQRFSAKQNLKTHIRIHTGEKPFACEYCGKRFSVAGPLKFHLVQHTGHRPYACDICGKRFVEPAKLRYHKQKHNGVKYHCEYCEKSYFDKYQLTNHRRIHTLERVHKCELCGKVFTSQYKLGVHVRTHTGEKPFSCDVCQETFARSDVLFAHKKKHTT